MRLTAQRILVEHLRKWVITARGDRVPRPRFWPDVSLDLVGATLIDFKLYGAMAEADFSNATFSGPASFDGATFSGPARFDGATFSGDARFDGATFSGLVRFGDPTFALSFARFVAAGLSFDQTRVLSLDDEHVWPTGWCLRPDGKDGYKVARANDADRS